MSMIAEVDVHSRGVVFAVRTDGNLSFVSKFFVAIAVLAGPLMDLSQFVVGWEGVETIQFVFIELAIVDAFDPDAVENAGDVPIRALFILLTVT